ncbi:hypothetical protein [Morganella morganii]|uniref:hypothetical protein n=1 Tax=Morganella morganii TaxID=582 RepID=UPI00237D419D|nr:hypothetical protein [Morganella morganii]EKQ1116224.1 hypothetical protein [Morganella morganii]MDE2535294.1 hypothetical protein [Morganella morganii]HCL5895377.1 hypothetical protein [Morganella morganii]HEO9687944.1 hypothetical protein [Morganella morganii subsp. morganii]
MNLDALRYLVNEEPEIIEGEARSCNLNEEITSGIARQVADQGVDSLSPNQRYYFDRAIRPLIENLHCTGFHTEGLGECNAPLPNEQLHDYYANDETLCVSCCQTRDRYNYLRPRN